MATLYSKVRGTLETLFQFGFGRAQIKSQPTGELESRNPTDAGFAVFRVKDPVGLDDAVTKRYADAATITATQVGQVVLSMDGATVSSQTPLTTVDDGWLVNDAGVMLVTG
jgi:hypothetical protein